jgi:hypothetical protein
VTLFLKAFSFFLTELPAGALHGSRLKRNRFAALATAAGQDFLSVLVAHAGTKAVDACSASLFRLIGSLGSHIGMAERIREIALFGKSPISIHLSSTEFDRDVLGWNDRLDLWTLKLFGRLRSANSS